MIGYPNLCPRVTFSSARQVIVEGLISNLSDGQTSARRAHL